MVNCPGCEADLDLDEDQLVEGGVVSCGGCGGHFEVVNPHPLELERLEADEDDDEDDDALDDDDEEEEDDYGYDDEDDDDEDDEEE